MRVARLTLTSLFTAIIVVLGSGAAAPAMAKSTPNLVKNPGAENGPASPDGSTTVAIPSWTQTNVVEQATVVGYGSSGTSLAMPGPANRGTQVWYGGVNSGAAPDLQQSVDVARYLPSIRAGGVKFAFSGYFGGFSNNGDTTAGLVTFENSYGKELKSVRIGDPTATDRGNTSGMLLFSASGKIPAKTRKVTVDLIFTYHDGGSNDGYADNISLKFSKG